jgi:GNAT superfamily N-acetyltransferase
MRQIVEAGFETYRSFAPEGWEPPDEARWDAHSREEVADPQVLCLIAEVEGEGMVGHVRLVPCPPDRPSRDGSFTDWHLRHLFVAQAHWGSGAARALHAACLDRLRETGGTARLFTPAAHGRARRFYEREGWALHDGPYFEPALGFDVVEYRTGPLS